MSVGPRGTLTAALQALRVELRLGYIEINGIIEGEVRFGGRTLDRVSERLSRPDWHSGLKRVVPRIHTAATKVRRVGAHLESRPSSLRDPEAKATLCEARQFLDDFTGDVEQWIREAREGRMPSFSRPPPARAFCAPARMSSESRDP